MIVIIIIDREKSPDDTGSCIPHTSKEACEEEKTQFDRDLPLCSWQEEDAPDSGQCSFREPRVTLQVHFHGYIWICIPFHMN
jgi:hypothetical protein